MNVQYLNITDYSAGLKLQEELVEKRARGEAPDTLVLLEHPAVIVSGRGAKSENILFSNGELQARGVSVAQSARGGDVTLHSEGQLVGYPVVSLKDKGGDLHKYLRGLEQAIINTLKEYSIEAERVDGLTGVWAGGAKIASIGIAVKNWVAYHGFALNVNNDLELFSLINPCGIKGVKMTSMSRILGTKQNLQEVAKKFAEHFEEIIEKNTNQ